VNKPYKPITHHSRAFTLSELMVTVVILGILAGISFVTFTKSWRDERTKAATRETAAWLDEARRIAIQKATPCRIRIDRDLRQLALDPNPNKPAEFCTPNVYASLELPTRIQNSSELILCSTVLVNNNDPSTTPLNCTTAQAGSSNVVFTPRGTAPTGLLIKFHMPQAGTDRCVAVMAPLGQIRSGKATSTGCDFTTAF
jgi:prepilin-type N-terminal cleavage/methylation domain-containing protein